MQTIQIIYLGAQLTRELSHWWSVVSNGTWPTMDPPLNKVDTTYKIDHPSDVKTPPLAQDDSPSTQAPEKFFPDQPE
jgi:hypothetical protein